MLSLIIYALLSLLLVLFAVTSLVSVHHLSLPQETITKLAIALPITAFALNLGYPFLRRAFPPSPSPKLLPAHLVPFAAQLSQALLSTILASLLFAVAASPEIVDCSLNTQWQHLFSNHDATAVKAIQESLQCCGFKTPRDRAWPWDNNGGGSCADVLGYTAACGPKWIAMSRAEAAKTGSVVVVAMLLQALVLLVARWRAERGRDSWSGLNERGLGWRQDNEEAAFRPLLEDVEEERAERPGTEAREEHARGETGHLGRGTGLILPRQVDGAVWTGGDTGEETGEQERNANDERTRDRNSEGW
ncbi:hypothetical protein BROUX41_001035 [Berkeleyomyces rouxiae]|uniref:uncharacterized protein n=1 Tax=Berkeleyomyces rouxiae TaxID=2035830 RepID=UPI003B773997